MRTFTTSSLEATLETIIDDAGLAQVVDSLMIVCQEKADHIRSSYQDEALAKVWDHAAQRIGRALPAAGLLPQ